SHIPPLPKKPEITRGLDYIYKCQKSHSDDWCCNCGSAKASKKAVNKQKYIIDASAPSQDKIFDSAAFEKFLHDRVKINGRTGQLGELVTISRSEDHKITITTNSHVFSKRYMKYLTKKFMKQHRIRDWLRVVATDSNTYQIRYFNISNDVEDEEEE
ncbi:10959_t:CDS:2, partial [Dentiscutata heterogama]